MPIIHERINRLPAEWRTLLAEIELRSGERKIPLRRPPRLFILVATPFAPLGLALMGLGAVGLARHRFPSTLAELLLACGFFVAVFMGFPGWRALYRRWFQARYYVCLDPQFFVERYDRNVTIIPCERLLHVHESVSVADFSTCLVYRDVDGRPCTYVTKNWYTTPHRLPTDLVAMIQQAYGIGPPRARGRGNAPAQAPRNAEK